MENQTFNIITPDMTTRNSLFMDGISPHTAVSSLVQSYLYDHNHQDDSGIDHVPNQAAGNNFSSSNASFYSFKRNFSRDPLLASSSTTAIANWDQFHEETTPNSAASVANFMTAKAGLQENLNNLAISVPPIYSSEVNLADHVSNDCSVNTSNSRFLASLNCGHGDEVLGFVTGEWDINKYSAPLELVGKNASEFQTYSSAGNLDPNGWLSSDNASNLGTAHSYGSSKFSNELSLTLATSQPSAITGMNIPGQCLDITRCGVARNSFKNNETMLGSGSDQTSCNSEELSLSFGSYRPLQLSQVILGSKYLCAVQEILAQIASFSLENVDYTSFLTNANAVAGSNTPFSSMPQMDSISDCSRLEGELIDPGLQRRAVETKKAKLLALLQMVDDRYNQCLDEIHTVVSAFHAATELDPQIHARFALQTISLLYKNLRERISNHCLAMGASFDPAPSAASAGDGEKSFEASFIQKQWALQQLKKKDHQLWRPQRGLPERSVSVLRAWMFQNFLHPYPKDAEKHLLAVKSGLTRSQVSNWFINARVRLWKPMIEEMYVELNRRKTRPNDNNTESNQIQRSGTISIIDNNNQQRYNM